MIQSNSILVPFIFNVNESSTGGEDNKSLMGDGALYLIIVILSHVLIMLISYS